MIHDLRYALRAFSQNRAFAAMAVLTLALGIGANTAIFTLVYGVLLKPLPYGEPHRLVRLTEGRPGFRLNVSYPNFLDWRARNHVFADMAIYNTYGSVVLSGNEGAAEVVPIGSAEAKLFDVLGISAARGRVFTADEEKASAPLVAVITDGLWRRRYSADPAIVGRTVQMDNDATTVIGVLPPDIRFQNVDVWFPMRPLSAMQLDRANHPGFSVVARLAPGVELDSAQQALSAIAADLAREYPASNKDMGVFVAPLLESISGPIRPTLLALTGAVVVLLLIACANVANLLLARALRRERETSIRAALGASRWRLLRLYFAEGLTLGSCGAAAGLLVAGWGVRILRDVPGLALPRMTDVAINLQVLGFAVLLAVGTAVVFAFAPALQLSRIDLMRVLRLSGSADAGTPRSGRLRATLVAMEVGLLVVLLSGAALMQRSLARLAEVDPGFRADGLLAVRNIPPGDYGAPHASSPEAMKDPAFIAKMKKGPMVFMTVSAGGEYAMGKYLAMWFVYQVVVSGIAAYVTGRALPAGAHYLEVFRFAGCTAFVAYAMALPQHSIWYRRNWGTTIRSMVDGLIYGLLVAGTFGWLWPR
jgi:putative ABC transport system permease protein